MSDSWPVSDGPASLPPASSTNMRRWILRRSPALLSPSLATAFSYWSLNDSVYVDVDVSVLGVLRSRTSVRFGAIGDRGQLAEPLVAGGDHFAGHPTLNDPVDELRERHCLVLGVGSVAAVTVVRPRVDCSARRRPRRAREAVFRRRRRRADHQRTAPARRARNRSSSADLGLAATCASAASTA